MSIGPARARVVCPAVRATDRDYHRRRCSPQSAVVLCLTIFIRAVRLRRIATAVEVPPRRDPADEEV